MGNKRPLYLLFTANAISGFAQGMSMLAIPWYFASRSESETFSFAYGAITILVLFFGLYAGTLVDRFSRKSNFMATSLVCGTIIGAIAITGALNGQLPPLLVIAVFGITMLNYNIHYPTLYAFAHEITEPDQYKTVNSWIEIVGQSTTILSGTFAALLLDGIDGNHGKIAGFSIHLPFSIAKWNIWEIFMLDAGTYFLSALLIYNIRYSPKFNLTPEKGSILKQIQTGFSYLLKDKKLMIFGNFSYAVFAALIISIHSLLPVYIDHHLHENGSVFAMSDLIYAIGALSAGLFAGKVFKQDQTVSAIVFLTFLSAGLFLWMWAAKSILVLYTFCIFLGFSNAGIRVLRLTYFFNHISNEVMGRVNSIFNMVNVLTRSLFIFLFSSAYFNTGNQIITAYLILALYLGISGIILLLYHRNPT